MGRPNAIANPASAPSTTPHRRRRVQALAWLLGGAISLAVFCYTQSREEQRILAAFQQRASSQETLLRERLARYEDILYSLRGLFDYSEGVTRAEFAGAAWDLTRRTAGIQALEWVPLVPAAGRAELERSARDAGVPGFEIRDRDASGEFVRAPERPEYTPLFYVEPVRGNEVVLGYDVSQAPAHAALSASRETGHLAGSAPLILAQEKEGQLGWVVACPVFSGETEPPDQGQLRGYVQGVFRLPDMLGSAWAGQSDTGVEILVVDIPRSGARQPIYFWRDGTRGVELPAEADLTRGMHMIADLSPAGRHWQLVMRPTAAWLASMTTHLPTMLAAAGVLLTALLANYLSILVGQSEETRRLVEERTSELAQSERSLSLALEAAQLGTWERDLVTGRLVWSPRSEQLVGLPPGAFDQRFETFIACVHPEDRERLLREIAVVRASTEPRRLEYRIVRPDGEVRWIASTGRGFLDENGKPRMAVGVVHDVTAAKEAEAELRRLATAVEQSSEMILVVDPQGRIAYANRAVTELTGLRPEELRGRELDSVPVETLPHPTFEEIRRGTSGGSPLAARLASRRPDGTRLLADVHVDCTRDAQGELCNYILLARDVTKETQLEEHLRTAQKMEALGLLASGIAHDFNNLLHVIMGNVGLAQAEVGVSASVRESLEQVREASDRAAQLTRQLLVFGRGEPGKRMLFDLNHTTREMIKMLGRIIGPQVTIDFQPSARPAEIVGDRGQIEQILLNLCVNARDAMAQGGALRIVVQPAAGNGEAEPPGVELIVSDTGAGMDKATLSRIYEPFFTTKPPGRGTGLGLAVVYSVVQQHQGRIDVESEPGRGTTFTIRFPAADGAASEPVPPTPRAIGGGRRETLLVADDEKAVRELARQTLTKAGYTVLLAADGLEACELFESLEGRVDLVVLDALMPRMGGREAAERIRARRPVPILFASGYTAGTLPPAAALGDQMEILTKPYRDEALLEKVRELLSAKPA